MDALNQLSPSDKAAIQSALGGSGGNLIPDSLMNIITISFIVMNVLGVIITIFYILGIIRKCKVQSAILHMQKDVAELKQALVVKQPEPAAVNTEAMASEEIK